MEFTGQSPSRRFSSMASFGTSRDAKCPRAWATASIRWK
jgi:hypothetical protein